MAKKLKKEIYDLVSYNQKLMGILVNETGKTFPSIYRWGRDERPELNQYNILVKIMEFINSNDDLGLPKIEIIDDLFETETIEL